MTNPLKKSSVLDFIWDARYDEHPYLFFYKNFDLIESWTYAQLWSSAQRVSQYLEKWPIKTPIFISLPNGPEFVSALFACQMQGLMPAPIVSPDIWNRQDYIEYISQISHRTGIKDIICHKAAKADLQAAGLNAILFDDIWTQTKPVDNLVRHPRMSAGDDIGLLQFSSGSTSDSKGVMLSQERICINLGQIVTGMGVKRHDRLCTWLPMYHDMGIIGGLFATFPIASEVHLSSPIDFVANPLEWLRHVSNKKATVMIGPDFMYKLLARKRKEAQFNHDISSLRVCMTGAEPVLVSTCNDFCEAFATNGFDPKAIMPVYGMAEAVLAVSFASAGLVKSTRLKEIETDWVSCGKPLEGIKVEIRDADANVLGPQKIGEIYINSPSQTVGFFQRPDLDVELLPNGWLKTGDLGFMFNDELFITGRTKDLIIVNGRKIHSIDIEHKIQEKWKDDFSRVAAVPASVATDNKALIIAIETRNWKSSKIEKKRIKLFLSSGSREIDYIIFFVPKKSLPRTSSGKLKRYKIREMYHSGALANLENQSFIKAINKKANELFFVLGILKKKFSSEKRLNVTSLDPLRIEIELLFRQIVVVEGFVDFKKPLVEWNLNLDQTSKWESLVEKNFGIIKSEDFHNLRNLDELCAFIRASKDIRKSG